MKKKLLLQDIVDCIAQHEDLSLEEADAFVRAFFDVVEQGLQEDKIVKIKGLGTFKLVAVSERESVNINTGERFQIEGHSKISFTPDSSMKELINRPFAHFESVELSEDTDAEEFNEVDREVELEFENADEDAEDDNLTEEDEEIKDEDEDFDTEEYEEGLDETQIPAVEIAAPSTSETPEDHAETVSIELEITPTPSTEEPASVTTTDHAGTDAAHENPSPTEVQPQEDVMSSSIELYTQEHIDNNQSLPGMEDLKKDETPQPTTIVPTDLAESKEQRETAKIRIDSNDEDNEAEDNSKSDSVTKNEVESNENTENAEEEIVVTPPRPITSDYPFPHTSNTMGYAYVEVPSRKQVNWWKRGVLTFLFLLLLIISYFAGYYNVLCPCSLPFVHCEDSAQQSQVALPAKTSTSEVEEPKKQPADSDALETAGQETEKVTDAQTDHSVQQPLNKTEEKKTSETRPEVNAKKDKQDAKTEETVRQKPAEKKQVKKAAPKTKEKEAKPRTHTVKVGDTLYKIARKYYGTEEGIHKIIKANNLKDADNIPLDKKLIIP